MPGDAVPGNHFALNEHPFQLRLGQPVQFPLLVSSTHLVDRPGDIVDIDPNYLRKISPIRTVLELPRQRTSDMISVIVRAELSEIGTLQLACEAVEGHHRWQLDFDVRSTVEADSPTHASLGEQVGIVDESLIEASREVLRATFGEQATIRPEDVLKRLSDATQLSRSSWPPSLLRAMWQQLIELDEGRRHSPKHESRWLNLVGYCLRPGYGYAADDWRVATTWRKVHGKLVFRQVSSMAEAIVLWRRISGGFTAGQQQALFQDILPRLKTALVPDGKASLPLPPHEATELFRLAGSLERISAAERSQLGKWLIAGMARKKMQPLYSAMAWTLGRIGARVPAYGPANQLLQASQVEAWLQSIIENSLAVQDKAFVLMQLARRTGDRYRDISDDVRQKVLQWMEQAEVSEASRKLVREIGQTNLEQQAAILGESLPLGLQILR